MGLEKTISSLGKKISNGIKVLSLVAFLTSCPTPNPEEETKKYNYITTVTPVESQEIDSGTGGIIEVTNPESLIYGTKLTIPSNALKTDIIISIGEVNNPPTLPSVLNYVGTPIDLEPEGITFNNPLTIQIPYSDSSLSDAGVSDDSNLKLYSYTSEAWEPVDILSIDTENNIITANLHHFSHYAITGFTCWIPEDLGNPQPGDLLYSLGAVWDEGNPQLKDNWMPGHVGIYTGEKPYTGGLATEDVKKSKKYNIIEAFPGGVRFSYKDPISGFSEQNAYAGAREPKDFTLTQQQREDIISFAEAQIGKPYALFQTTVGVLFGLARGSLVKGDFGRFNCVGLAEAAYEHAGANNGEGLVSFWQEEFGNEIEGFLSAVLTPAEQYAQTKPATGSFSLLELKTDDGTCEKSSSWAGAIDSIHGNVSDNTFGVYALLTPPAYPFHLTRIKIFFKSRHSDMKKFYLHVWDEQHSVFLQSLPIESNEISTLGDWWVKDISEYEVTINSGKIKIGFCESYLPWGNDSYGFPKTGWGVGVDKDNIGNCYIIDPNHPHGAYDKWTGGNLMIRGEGY